MTFGAGTRLRPLSHSLWQRLSSYERPATADLLLGGALALTALVATLLSYQLLTPYILNAGMWDFWFESDPARTVFQATNRHATFHYATNRHPLFSLIIYPPGFILAKAFGLGTEVAFGIILAATSAIATAITYATLRILDLPRPAAAIFTILAAVSAAAVFWFPVPETWGLSALSLLVVIGVCALSDRLNGLPTWAYLLASIAAISITTTNWMAALAMLFIFLDRRTALITAGKTLLIVMALQTLQHSVFPHAGAMLALKDSQQDISYLLHEESLGFAARLSGFFFHSIVMPDIGSVYGARLSVQGALPGEGSWLTFAAVLVWAVLLALGGWSAVRLLTAKAHFRFRRTTLVLLATLAGQLLLFSVYGLESFMYALPYAPLLVLLSALSALTPAHRLAVPLAAALIILAGLNNYAKFSDAADQFASRYEHERGFAAVLAQNTEANALILCGGEALAATGEAKAARLTAAQAPIADINPPDSPDTCALTFDDVGAARRGWLRWYEDWSVQEIETFAQRGARYFATSYAYGLEHRKELFDALDQRFKRLARTPEWAIYDLKSPPAATDTD
jgi:hypothetical protein